MKWVKATNGETPHYAQVGGEERDHEPIYLARAMHNGALTPGKLIESHKCAYISWGGREIKKYEYEVLVDGPTNWVKTSGSTIPQTAYPGGKTENDEVLFIGRVNHGGSLIPGKVQASQGCLFIPWNGKEESFKEYEILCH